MKKRLILVSTILVALGVVWMWFAPRIRVDYAARYYNPHELDLSRVDPMHKSLKVLPNGIEVGLLHLSDGTDVKYWFINRHVQPGLGTTRFDSSDGRTTYIHGVYCCEVSVPELRNWSDLQAYITKNDGSPP